MKKFLIWLRRVFKRSDLDLATYYSPYIVGRRTDNNDTVILSPYVDFREETEK